MAASLTSGVTIPRRRKTDNLPAPTGTGQGASLEVLYERVYRIEATVNGRFDGMETRMNAFREEYEDRVRTIERTIWMAVGAAAAVTAVLNLLLR